VASPAPSVPTIATSSDIEFETHGIESIPDADRQASVFDFMRVCWGGANSLATAVLGVFPIVFGLSLAQALVAIIAGLAVGSLILAPMSVFGPITGTNNAVASSAHFGVVGRIVGSFLSLLTAIAFFSISVWSSGDAVIGAARELFGVRASDGIYALAYAVFALSVLAICVYGFRLMLFVNKVAVVASSLLFLVGLVAFAPQIDPGFAGAGLKWGSASFWPPFVSAALVTFANPISFGAFLGDWSRYVPRTTSRKRLMAATAGAQLLTILPFGFGTATAAIISSRAPEFLARLDYTGGLLSIAPGWLVLPLFLLALLSGLSTGTTSLYGTGLDFSSVFPRLSRPQATLLIGMLAFVLIFVGRFAFSLVDSITAFITLIVVMTTPWMIVMMLGYCMRRGYYLPEAMQVFNRGQYGGPYWFWNGWNVAGMGAWIASAIAALLTVNIPGHFVGPLGRLAGDLDLSLVAAVVLPVFLYPLFLRLFPEPRAVFGPDGPWLMPCSDVPVLAVRDRR
jgi:purine-cytosine permease-like protein